jgi:cytochrome c oxidase subunit 2
VALQQCGDMRNLACVRVLATTTYWGSPKGVTTNAPTVHGLWNLSYAFALPIAAIVLGGIIWCVVRYRKRPGEVRRARQIQYHIPIEAAYTIIPLIIVAIIFGFMYRAENKVDALSKHPFIAINVQGFQWGWRFTYPNGHQQVGSIQSQPNINVENGALPVLYLPEHETVQLTLQSDDVNHSFYVPEFLFKRDMIQGIHNVIDINVTTTGRWIGECTQLCGTYHAFMRFEVDVLPVSQFEAWYHAQAPNSINYTGESQP